MTHEQQPPEPLPPPDDQSSQAETAPLPGTASPDMTEPLPDSEQPEQHDTTPPQIWVGSLSDYNNGILHGVWMDAAREADVIQADIDAMLASSPWTTRTGEPKNDCVERDGVEPVAHLADNLTEP